MCDEVREKCDSRYVCGEAKGRLGQGHVGPGAIVRNLNLF